MSSKRRIMREIQASRKARGFDTSKPVQLVDHVPADKVDEFQLRIAMNLADAFKQASGDFRRVDFENEFNATEIAQAIDVIKLAVKLAGGGFSVNVHDIRGNLIESIN